LQSEFLFCVIRHYEEQTKILDRTALLAIQQS